MKLIQLEVNAFGGINPNSPVIIDFTAGKFAKLDGDNGVGKTSVINSLLVATGQLSRENKNFVNNESGKIDINFQFVGKDRLTYDVRCTKSSFTLSYEGERVPEPISKMKELLGVVGVSPMEIKNSKLQVIIKWLASYSNKSPEEFEDAAFALKTGINQAKDVRAQANRSYKALVEYLNEEPLFINWSASEKKYTTEPDIKALSKKLEEAGKKSDAYIKYEATHKAATETRGTMHQSIIDLELEIAEKQRILNEKKEALQKQDDALQKGQLWLKDNKKVKTDYDDVKNSYDNAAQDLADYNKWKEVVKKKEERDGYETISQTADLKEKQLLKEMAELQAEILPDIKGVELVLEDTHEEGGVMKKEGLYWNGRNVAQMSETEWWDIVLLIWRKYKVKVVVIDNFQSLGSDAVDILQKLSKDGCYILAAEMNREQKTLQIDYKPTL